MSSSDPPPAASAKCSPAGYPPTATACGWSTCRHTTRDGLPMSESPWEDGARARCGRGGRGDRLAHRMATSANIRPAAECAAEARQWVGYAGASLLVAARLIGVIMGRVLSKLAAAFSNPFVDPGRDPRPCAAPRTPRVGALPVRLRRHAGNLRHRSHRLFDKTGPLLVVLGWLGGLSLAPTLVLAGDRLR